MLHLFFQASIASLLQPPAPSLKTFLLKLLLILNLLMQMKRLFYDVYNKKTLFL